MHNTLCDKYGFNTAQRKLRVAMMGLSAVDIALVKLLHGKIIEPYGEEIVADFYEALLSFPEVKAFLLEHGEIDSLHRTQLAYLQSYGVNLETAEYFEERLQIGRVHALIGLPLSYYLMAFRILDDLLFDFIVKSIASESGQFLPLMKLVSRISALDMSLAIDAYHTKKVRDMNSSIDALMDERQLLTSKIGLDELTQVASRARVLDYLQANLKKAEQKQYCFCVAMIDLDFFKSVNDKYGHLVGDQVLTDVAARMKAVLRGGDVLGRYGGDEFLLVLPRADMGVAKQITERICGCINAKAFQAEDYAIPLTVSIGVAVWQQGDTDLTLLARVDHALYQAKHQGRNRVVLESSE